MPNVMKILIENSFAGFAALDVEYPSSFDSNCEREHGN
jgi:hypothetical protein